MTDKDVIKTLECCIKGNCFKDHCPLSGDIIDMEIDKCTSKLSENALALINSQQAEVERLKEQLEEYPFKCKVGNNSEIHSKSIQDYDRLIDDIQAEAVKEFAEKLIMNITINNTNDGYLDYAVDYNCLIEDIQDLVKEMIGE